MRLGNDRRERTRSAGSAHFVGKRRFSPLPSHAILAALTMLLPVAAHPKPLGPSSSGSVEISVSVAPRFKVSMAAASDSASVRQGSSSRPCLAANVPALTLPVLLLPPSARGLDAFQAGAGQEPVPGKRGVTAIMPCGHAGDHNGATASLADKKGDQLWLVRPE